MGFWFYMLFICSLIPLTMIVFGYCFGKKAPQKINSVFGYRTRRSMRNQETWQFAHQHCGRLWLRVGITVLCLSCGSMVAMLFVLNRDTRTVGTYGGIVCGIQLALLILSIFPTEIALKRKYG